MSLPSPPLPSPLLSLSLLPLPIILILTAQTLTQYFPRPPHSKFSFEIKRNHFANISLPRPQLALSSALCVDSRVWMKIYLQPSLWPGEQTGAVTLVLLYYTEYTPQSTPVLRWWNIQQIQHVNPATIRHNSQTRRERNFSEEVKPGEPARLGEDISSLKQSRSEWCQVGRDPSIFGLGQTAR